MTLQARLTLWSMLVMASIVTIVSLADLVGEVNREFEYALDRADLIANIVTLNPEFQDGAASGFPPEYITGRPHGMARSSSLDQRLLNLTGISRAVDEIVITDQNGRVAADSRSFTPNEIYSPRPDLTDFVRHAHWWRKYWVLYNQEDPYEIAQTLQNASRQKIGAIHVLLRPSVIRSWVEPILSDHAWIAIFFVAFAVLAAFLFATIAFHPLGQLGKMLDQVASGYDLQQILPEDADEFGIVASKVSLLGRQLKGAQTEFSDLKGNFESLLAEMEDAVLIFGRDRRLISAAGGIESYLSRPRIELVGLTVNEVFPAATSIGLLLSQSMQTGRPIQNRAVPVSVEKDGSSRLRIVLVSVEFLSAQSGLLIRLRDPEATRQIGRQLQIADRLSAISRLTSGVAHEVKNPLNAILMHVELAKLKLAHGDYDVNPQMDILTSEILRLDRVVKTFLDFTRPVQLNLVEVDLREFVEELVDLARPQAAACGITVELTTTPEPVTITIDPDLFKQATLNIVVNAIEAMPNGGKLGFRASARGEQAEIRISDNGPGIPPELREKIYNLYFTTKQKGSGIGLSMTFRVIQLHDGTIDFESKPGQGTTFTLRVPTTPAPNPAVAT